MCDMDEPDIICWYGWKINWADLRLNGWEITHKKHYCNWRDSTNTSRSNNYIYIRHPASNMIGRITLGKADLHDRPNIPISYVLDFLTVEHNQRIKKKPVYLEKEVTERDMQGLYDLILGLQENRPKTRRKKRKAQIINLRKSA